MNFCFQLSSEVRQTPGTTSMSVPGFRFAFLEVLSCLPHNLSDVFYRSFRSTSLAYLPARAVFEVPKPEVVPYEYESLLYSHPLSSQPVDTVRNASEVRWPRRRLVDSSSVKGTEASSTLGSVRVSV